MAEASNQENSDGFWRWKLWNNGTRKIPWVRTNYQEFNQLKVISILGKSWYKVIFISMRFAIMWLFEVCP
jgi:hypothetical protein